MKNKITKYDELKSLIDTNNIYAIEEYIKTSNINKLYNDKTILMIAIESKKIDIAELLIKRGANPNIKNDSGKKAFDFVTKNNQNAFIKILVNAGAEIENSIIKKIKNDLGLKKFIIQNSNKNLSESVNLYRNELISDEVLRLTEVICRSILSKNDIVSEKQFNKIIHKELSELLLIKNDLDSKVQLNKEYSKLYKKLEQKKLYRKNFTQNYKNIIDILDIILEVAELIFVIPCYSRFKPLVMKFLLKDKTVDLMANLLENIGVIDSVDKDIKILLKNSMNKILSSRGYNIELEKLSTENFSKNDKKEIESIKQASLEIDLIPNTNKIAKSEINKSKTNNSLNLRK